MFRWTLALLLTAGYLSATSQSLNFSRVTLPPDLEGSRGVAFGDADLDGDWDIVVANTLNDKSPQASPIYFNGKGFDKKFISEDKVYWSESVNLVDVDNDRDLDAFFATQFDQVNPLYLNDGKGGFTKSVEGDLANNRTNSPGACWCDFDRDGDLDVFVVNRDDADDQLYVNDSKGKLDLITSGPWIGNKGDGRSCAWGDLDGDGWPDLYVTNFVVKENGEVVDSHRNYLYLNKAGKFAEVKTGIHVEEKSPTYGVEFIDIDYDRDIDIYITNVSSRTGNALYVNDGHGNFTKPESPLTDFTNRPSKGQTWGDFNNDGLLDVYIANGTEGYPEIQNYLFLGEAKGSFRRIYDLIPVVDAHISAGTASADIDQDGDLDIYVCNWGGDGEQNDLYRNETNSGNWIKFRLKGSKSNSFGIGCWVIIETDLGSQTRYHYPQTGYGSQNGPEVHFGLGEATVVKSIAVIWPNGETQSFQNVSGNRTYEVRENRNQLSLVK